MPLTARPDDRLTELASPAVGVRLWALRLEPRDGDRALGCLSAEDAERLASLRPPHAGRLLARRALLRTVVADLAGCRPDTVRVVTEPSRRVAVPGAGDWFFSSASSGSRGLLALADAPVGVDLEALPGPPDALQVSRHFLASAEHEWITAGADPADRFLRIWVRKEAVVKCTGEGLADARLDGFVVDGTSSPAPVVTPQGRPLGIWTHGVELAAHVVAVASGRPPA